MGLPTMAALGAGAGVAIGAAAGGPGTDGTISACYDTGNGRLRMFLDPAATAVHGGPCEVVKEAPLTWNTAGPTGPPGAQGPPGPAGPGGAQGATGTPLIGRTAFGLSNAGQTFLKLDGIDGESTDKGHKGEIDISSFAVEGGGGSAGKVKFNDFVITKKIDKASPVLLQACANGKHISKATITVRKAGKGQQEFLVMKLTDVLISSYQRGAQNGSGQPAEELHLTFQKASETFYDTKGKSLGQQSFKLTTKT